MTIYVVIATESYERGYEIVGARQTEEAAAKLAIDAKEGRFLPMLWVSEWAQKYYEVEDAKGMDYHIEEVPVG